MASLFTFEEGDVLFAPGALPDPVPARICLRRWHAQAVAVTIARARYLTKQQLLRTALRGISPQVADRQLKEFVQLGILLPVRWGTPPDPRPISVLAAAYAVGPSAPALARVSGVNAPAFSIERVLRPMPEVARGLIANELWSRVAALPFARTSGYAARPVVEAKEGKARPAAMFWYERGGRFPMIVDVLLPREATKDAVLRQAVYAKAYEGRPKGADDEVLAVWVVPKDEDGKKLFYAFEEAGLSLPYAFTTEERLREKHPGEAGWLFVYQFDAKAGVARIVEAPSPRFAA